MDAIKKDGKVKAFQNYPCTHTCKRQILHFVKETVINDKNYMRLACTHHAFSKLEKVMIQAETREGAKTKAKKCIIELITRKLDEIDKKRKRKK